MPEQNNNQSSGGYESPQQPAYTMKKPQVFVEGDHAGWTADWTMQEDSLFAELANSGIAALDAWREISEKKAELDAAKVQDQWKIDKLEFQDKLKLMGSDEWYKAHILDYTPILTRTRSIIDDYLGGGYE